MNHNDQTVIVEKIRLEYTHIDKEHTQLDALMELDQKAKIPAKVFVYIFSSIGVLVMGSGMSLIMTDIGAVIGIGNTMLPGITLGLIGMLMACIDYPLYHMILKSRKMKYAPQVIKLSKKIASDK